MDLDGGFGGDSRRWLWRRRATDGGAVLWWRKIKERKRHGGDRETKGRCCFGC